jgi:hypothetical protein
MKTRYVWLNWPLAGDSLATRGLKTVVVWLIVSNYLVKQILARDWEMV